MKVAIFFALFVATASAASNPQRIVGGQLTTIDQYPSISSLLYSENLVAWFQRCGGIIINNRAILSAAHCFYRDPINRWRIRVGSTFAHSGGVMHAASNVIIHPNFDDRTLDSDICVVHSASAFTFNNNVRAASIAGSNYWVGDYQPVWAAGWGSTFDGGPGSNQLRHVMVLTVNQDICRANYGLVFIQITENMLCSGWPTGGRDQCDGDSGGPLYHNGVVVGVCSFGLGCGLDSLHGVNARVSRFSSWIAANA
ncbi:trypsin, alkaline B-like [Spodoptera litura]|uniref:Trypsin, alkaline B-like n=1 Tax=Spodoptera litura TaxID=69820 RepID=A0A9J7DZY6_SPOLT|nr:trypsin, alkaline B-like [Spodoptera litura]